MRLVASCQPNGSLCRGELRKQQWQQLQQQHAFPRCITSWTRPLFVALNVSASSSGCATCSCCRQLTTCSHTRCHCRTVPFLRPCRAMALRGMSLPEQALPCSPIASLETNARAKMSNDPEARTVVVCGSNAKADLKRPAAGRSGNECAPPR